MWLFTFLDLLFSQQGAGSKLFLSFPHILGTVFFSLDIGASSMHCPPQPLPCFPSANGEITIGLVNPDTNLPLFQELFPQCMWLCDVTDSGRDVTHPWRRGAGMGVSPSKDPTASEPRGRGSSDRPMSPLPSPPLQRRGSGDPRSLRGGFCSPGKREGARPG